MAGRLAVDFGTSNTVVAVWDESRGEGVPLHVSEYGRTLTYRRAGTPGEQIALIPSLIHYAEDGRRWLGQQVVERGLYGSPQTFRWMKRYVGRRSPLRVRAAGRDVGPGEAGREFLAAVLASAAAELDVRDEEVALTVPVEAFEHYADWLADVAGAAGMRRWRLIDEASAAALGYGVTIQPGDIYLTFDFGGGTLDVAVVRIEAEPESAAGRGCRALGKAGADVGGATIDGWLFQEVLRQAGRSDADEEVRPLSRALLAECERAKELLSFHEHADVKVRDAATGVGIAGRITRGRLEALFDRHEAFTQIDRTIRRALNAARERGYGEDQVKAVLMVGGSSLIPSVQQLVQRIFGRDRVRLQRPLDAVARGAAAFVAGIAFYDHIQHDYAIRHLNAATGGYEYRTLVEQGAPYPTREPVARLTVKASYDGQAELGIAVFELAERAGRTDNRPVELVFDSLGAARLQHVSADDADRRQHFWVNEHSPTFLPADPPARKGEPRFEVEFGIDVHKRLTITARDLQTGRLTHEGFPVVKLT